MIYLSLPSKVDHELFTPEIRNTVSALAETYLFVGINILGIFEGHHTKLIFQRFKFYPVLREPVDEKYCANFVRRLSSSSQSYNHY